MRVFRGSNQFICGNLHIKRQSAAAQVSRFATPMSAWARFARQIDLSLVKGTPFQSYSEQCLIEHLHHFKVRTVLSVRSNVWVRSMGLFCCYGTRVPTAPIMSTFPYIHICKSTPLPASETAPRSPHSKNSPASPRGVYP